MQPYGPPPRGDPDPAIAAAVILVVLGAVAALLVAEFGMPGLSFLPPGFVCGGLAAFLGLVLAYVVLLGARGRTRAKRPWYPPYAYPPPAAPPTKCDACGAALSEGATLCSRCGAAVPKG